MPDIDIVTFIYILVAIPGILAIGYEILDLMTGNHPLQHRTKK